MSAFKVFLLGCSICGSLVLTTTYQTYPLVAIASGVATSASLLAFLYGLVRRDNSMAIGVGLIAGLASVLVVATKSPSSLYGFFLMALSAILVCWGVSDEIMEKQVKDK